MARIPPLTVTPRRQQTIGQAAQVKGFGYWSGLDVQVEFRPAPPNTGVVFVRRDINPPQRVPALLAHRVETPRRTVLAIGAARVEMVEHIMAALGGLNIDNVEVWVDQPEMPGCDGSSLPFVEALEAAGVVQQAALRPQLWVSEVTRVGNDDFWVEAQPIHSPRLEVKYRLDYGADSPIGRQTLELAVTPETFRQELAPARTFILQDEAEWLRRQGLGVRVSARDLLVFNDEGAVDNVLRFEAECVRHKALDMIGDLALAGCDLFGRFVAYRSGHRLNAELVGALLAEGRFERFDRKTA